MFCHMSIVAQWAEGGARFGAVGVRPGDYSDSTCATLESRFRGMEKVLLSNSWHPPPPGELRYWGVSETNSALHVRRAPLGPGHQIVSFCKSRALPRLAHFRCSLLPSFLLIESASGVVFSECEPNFFTPWFELSYLSSRYGDLITAVSIT